MCPTEQSLYLYHPMNNSATPSLVFCVLWQQRNDPRKERGVLKNKMIPLLPLSLRLSVLCLLLHDIACPSAPARPPISSSRSTAPPPPPPSSKFPAFAKVKTHINTTRSRAEVFAGYTNLVQSSSYQPSTSEISL